MDCVVNGVIPSTFKGNVFSVINNVFYQTLSPMSISFSINQKTEITIMAWGPGGNSGPDKNNFNYINKNNCCNSTVNSSLPKNGSWRWLPDETNVTTYSDTTRFKFPIIEAPFGGGGSGAFAESNFVLEPGTYYYNIGTTSGTKTWFGPSLNDDTAYVIADSGYDATPSFKKTQRDKTDPNLDLNSLSISFGGAGGKISESRGDIIISGNKGSDSYSTNISTGGSGGAPVNPIDNYNGAGGSFGGNGEPGKILLKIENGNLNTFDFGQIYYNFNSQSNLNCSIKGTFEIYTKGSVNLNNISKFTRISGYTDDVYQNIDDGSQKVPGEWTDPSGVDFSLFAVDVKLGNIGNTKLTSSINGYISNEMRVNKLQSFNTLRCWIVSYNIGDNTCNC